jgi:hypothetical protein
MKYWAFVIPYKKSIVFHITEVEVNHPGQKGVDYTVIYKRDIVQNFWTKCEYGDIMMADKEAVFDTLNEAMQYTVKRVFNI